MTLAGFVGKFANDFQNIVINKGTILAINGQNAVFRNLIEYRSKLDFIQKRHIIIEFDSENFGLVLLGLRDFIIGFEIVLDDNVQRNQ